MRRSNEKQRSADAFAVFLPALLCSLPPVLAVWCVGGRREWSLDLLTQTLLWTGILLHLVFLARQFSVREAPPGSPRLTAAFREPVLAWAVLLPWMAAIWLGWRGTHNPAFVPLDNTLLAEILPIEHDESRPTTINPIRSRLFLSFYASLAVFLAGAWLALRTRRAVRLLLALLVANGAVLAFAGIAAKTAGAEKMLGFIDSHTTSFFATIYYKNHWGALVILWLGVAMGLALDSWKRARVAERFPEAGLAFLLLLSPLLLSIFMAQARASALVALGLCALFAGTGLRAGWKNRSRALNTTLCLAGAGAVVGSLFWVATPQTERMVQRSERQVLQWLDDPGAPPDARLAAYRSAASIVAARPVWGWGAGSFPYIFPLYADESLLRDDGKVLFFEFVHNDYLQLAAEHGAVGAGLVVLTPALAFIATRRWRHTALALWTGAGAGGVLILALIDFPFGNPAATVTFWLVLTASLAHRRASCRTEITPRSDRPRSPGGIFRSTYRSRTDTNPRTPPR